MTSCLGDLGVPVIGQRVWAGRMRTDADASRPCDTSTKRGWWISERFVQILSLFNPGPSDQDCHHHRNAVLHFPSQLIGYSVFHEESRAEEARVGCLG
jgi:hypothetical protein